METGTLTLSEELGVLAKLRADAATHDGVTQRVFIRFTGNLEPVRP